jgi:hypothetical protein
VSEEYLDPEDPKRSREMRYNVERESFQNGITASRYKK